MTRAARVSFLAVFVAAAAATTSSRLPAIERRRDSVTNERKKIGAQQLVASTLGTRARSFSFVDAKLALLSMVRCNPGLVLIAASVYLHHKRSRAAKRREMDDIRSQVTSGQDFHIAIVTTAALPWLTGTAVNPLLRAAYLAKAGRRVTLMVPWLHPMEQQKIFPGGMSFETPSAQEAYMLEWLRTRGGLSAPFRLVWYPGRYDAERGSILPLGDITRFFGDDESDICVLEEPEHLTWYHSGPSWRHRFKLVVGVVHTNYVYYARTLAKGGGPLLAATMQAINHHMCQAYCDKVIKLSETLQPLPRACVCNVHGVRADFLEIGSAPPRRFKKGAYFIGKALWAKGHRLLIDYLHEARARGDEVGRVHVDLYGKGEDLADIRAEAAAKQLDLSFLPPTDHAGETIRDYKVFVNPSESEVLSTTTAEALAMGKFVVLQRHPSNDFFLQFANALPYDTPSEFLLQLKYALVAMPTPLTADERRVLSWEGATERFLAELSDASRSPKLPSLGDETTRWVHTGIQQGGALSDGLRHLSGAGPVSKQSWMAQYPDAPVTDIVALSVEKTPPPGEAPTPAQRWQFFKEWAALQQQQLAAAARSAAGRKAAGPEGTEHSVGSPAA